MSGNLTTFESLSLLLSFFLPRVWPVWTSYRGMLVLHLWLRPDFANVMVAIWLFLKESARNKMIWVFGHF
jgi:hypothetical protein